MITTVLFDLDGTLVDTEPAAVVAIEKYLANLGQRIDIADAHAITGITWDSGYDRLAGKYKLPGTRKEAIAEMLRLYRQELRNQLTIVPGARECVRAMAGKFDLGLVSGSYREDIFAALDYLGIRDHFGIVLGAEDYPASKPAPDGYAKALRHFGKAGGETLIFEDSAAGIASALAVGAWVVAITGTNHHQQDVSRAHSSVTDLRGMDATWVERFSAQRSALKN